MKEIEDIEEFEESVDERTYLGWICLAGVILGVGVIAGIIYTLDINPFAQIYKILIK